MSKSVNLMQEIKNFLPRFSKGQKLIANYILNYYDKAAYMTASKLGEVVEVSESTVVRFAVELGYDGYPKFQKALQELVKNKLTSLQRIEVSSKRISEENSLKDVLNSDLEKIKMTIEEIDTETFNKTVDMLYHAKKIYIVGVRSSFFLATFLSFYLNFMCDNVILVNANSAGEMFEQLFRVEKGDVVFAISFPRYSKRTAKAVQYVKNQGAFVITLTDSKVSTIANYSDQVLIARSDMVSFADSLVAPLSMINALIVGIGFKKKVDVFDNFKKLEEIWEEYDVYEKT